jgi:membrane protease YdiL (CAAX protease family)
LFLEHPGLPWRARDVLGIVGALGFLGALCFWWCIPLGLIHYRGLVNRARAGTAQTNDGLQLRHAWWGLSAFMLASFLSLYAVGPIDWFSDLGSTWAVVAEPPQLAKLLLVESLLGIVLVTTVARPLRRHFERWWSTSWSIGKCILLGVAVGLLFRVPMLLLMFAGFDLSAALRLDDGLWQSLLGVDEVYGPAAALWIIVIAAPVGEEFLFRGLLLRAAQSHVSFPLANTVQAVLFAAVHQSLAAAPYLFACGLAFGWLARRSGGLLAPMIAHAVFNLVAGFLLVS